MSSGLRQRLLLLLLVPLFLLSALNTWFDFRSADSAAFQRDSELLQLLPLLADSIVGSGGEAGSPPVLLIAPPVDYFLHERPGMSAFAVLDTQGRVVAGSAWLVGKPPGGYAPDFATEEFSGVSYRIVSQRVKTVAGELVVRLADGSDPRQQWLRMLWLKALLPNVVLIIAALFAVNWAVYQALRPLLQLKEDVERRSPRDLSAMDPGASPDEVRPLVLSLNRLFSLVDAQAESQRRFVADAAHQLRTPLAGLQAQIEAWAQVAEAEKNKQNNAPAGTEYAQAAITLGADQVLKVRHAVRRTSQLANQLLALSRADARSAHTHAMQRIDLKQLCEDMLEAHLDAASAKGLDLGLDASSVHVAGHEWLLRELVGNLVDNAIQYTPPGGRVTLRCGRKHMPGQVGLQAFLEVEDDGPGVPPAEWTRMLERFYRVPGTAGEGNGLGLAIAEEIARVHQSRLQVEEGTGGRGLRVSLWLPS